MTEQEQKSMVGTTVMTLQDAGGTDWSGMRHCRWGILGRIVDYSNSHGLCYKVQHEDGSYEWYDPEELSFLG